MRTRFTLFGYSVAMLLLAFVTAGCNVFDFASDAEMTPTEQAQEAIRDGNYAKARSILAEDVEDSTDAMALYLDAKATLLASGVDVVKIADLVDAQGGDSGDNLGILDVIDDLSDAEKTAWYQANQQVTANLSRIFNGAAPGPFTPEDVALGYTVSNLMSGVLGIRDTNRDNVIDSNDFTLNLSYSDDAQGYVFDGGSIGDGQQFTGLTAFLGAFALKTATPGVVGAAGYEPDDINGLIAYVMYLLDNSRGSIRALIGADNSTFDVEDIDSFIEEIAAVINYYWYDDGIDTDGDGRTDEEIIDGLDNDGDGLVDEDSKFYPGADLTNTRNTQYYTLWQAWSQRTAR